MFRRIVCCLAVVSLSNSVEAADDRVNFTDHVRPIFRDKCFSCHNTNKKSANLDLSTYTSLMQGGASGEVISPGSAEDSYLYMLITHESEPTMPPESDPIPEPMRETVRKWIDAGAPETSSSKVMLPKKPKVDLTVTISAGDRPSGPLPVPDVLNLEPVVHADSTTAVSAIATSPWAPVTAIAGHKQVVLYDSASLQMSGILPFPEGQIRVLRFSRNGSLLLAGGGRGGSRGLAVVWNVRTGERVFEVGDELDEVLAADISADHEFVALGGPQKIVRVYNTGTGELAWEVTKHTDWVTAVEFSPDTVLLATADRAGGLHVWESFTGRHYATLLGHKAQMNAVSWRIDSNVLASASKDASIKLWEMEGGKNIKSWNAHGGGTTCVEFCRDGRVVSCGRDKVTKLWDQNGKQLVAFEAFGDLALRVSHCDETNRVIAGDWTGAIRAWSATDGKRIGELTSNPPLLATRLAAAESALPAALQAQKTARATLDQATAAHQAEADKLTAAQQMLKQAQDQVAKLTKAKADQEPPLTAAKATRDSHQKQLAALEKAIPSLQKSSDSAAAAAAALPEDKALAEAAAMMAGTLQTRTESAAAIRPQLEAAKQDVTAREAAFAETVAGLKQAQSTVASADAAVKASTTALQPLKAKMEESRTAATAADSKANALQTEVDRWKQYIALRDELRAMQEQATVRDTVQLAKLEAEALVQEHAQKIDASKNLMQSHQQTVATQQKMTSELQARIAATKQTEAAQQELTTKHTQAIPVLQEALQKAETAIALLPDDAAIKSSIDSLSGAIAAKQESMKAAQQAVSAAQQSMKNDQAAMATATEAMQTAQAMVAAEQKNLTDLQTAAAPLTEAASKASVEFDAAVERHQQAIRVVENRRAQLRPAGEVTQASTGS